MSALFDAIIRGSIKNRYLVLLAALALVAIGAWAARSGHLDALPDFTPPMVVVQAEAPGLGSADTEQLVTTPLEQALLGIPGVTNERSTSSPGLSVIDLTFQEGTDIFRARQLVSEHIADARERLPAEMPAPRLAPITAPVGAVVKFAYTAPEGDHEALEKLWRFAQWKLRPRLQAIEGVSRVTVHGGAAARIEVRPDPAKMLARHVTLSQLEQSLAQAQSLAALGHTRAGPQQEPVRTGGFWLLGHLQPIANTVITTRHGLPVRVSDVADVTMGEEPPVGSALYDGKPAIYIQVDKLPWADTLQVTKRVEDALAQLDAKLPAGTRRQPPTFRQADFIDTSLFSVGRAMTLGAFFVILVLFLLLRSPRLSAISLTALPLSVVAAVTVLLLMGVTINGMILGGLAIAVGEVVDDAIVDVENIWRRLKENARAGSPRPVLEVIRDASSEVRSAVVYASLIVVVVLLPIVLLGGLAGRIFSPLAEAYALAVAASLVVALTVTPALSALLLPKLADKGSEEPRLTRLLRSFYERVLGVVRAYPGRIVLVSAVAGIAALVILPMLGGGFLPEFHEGVLIAEVSAPPGTSLQETTRLAGRVSKILREEAGVPHVAARIGRASLDEDAAPVHRMELDLVLPKDSGDPDEVVGDIIAKMNKLPGIRFSVEGFLGERINELLSGERAPIAVKLYGQDLSALQASASKLITAIAKVPGVQAARSASLADVPTLDLHIDQARLASVGARRSEVIDAAAAWRQGIEVTDVKARGGFSVPVVIAGGDRFRDRQALGDLPIFISPTTALPLSSFATLDEGVEPPAIHHENGRRVVTVAARADTAELTDVAQRIAVLARKDVPQDIDFKIAGQAAERRQAGGRLVLIAALVLTAMFAFLWMAFGSVVDAAVVLAGLPLGMVGGATAALLLPDGLSMAGLIGFVALSGIISRNGIMLVAHKNALIDEHGQETESVILQAARERLLPIIMTASTAFFGLLPLAASLDAAGSELEAPMAFIVCGGLLTATTLNLVAVPALYLWKLRRRQRS